MASPQLATTVPAAATRPRRPPTTTPAVADRRHRRHRRDRRPVTDHDDADPARLIARRRRTPADRRRDDGHRGDDTGGDDADRGRAGDWDTSAPVPAGDRAHARDLRSTTTPRATAAARRRRRPPRRRSTLAPEPAVDDATTDDGPTRRLSAASGTEVGDGVGDGERAAGVGDVEVLDHPAVDRDHAATLGLGGRERLDDPARVLDLVAPSATTPRSPARPGWGGSASCRRSPSRTPWLALGGEAVVVARRRCRRRRG